VSDTDVQVIGVAVASALEARPDIDPALLGFLGDILLLRVHGEAEAELAGRFQQLTGAVMAKGIEDTAFYRYVRLTALNDVGCEPGRFGTSIEAYHAANSKRASDWPATMLTTSTHDTKRSEDVRTRIAALSEAPDRWRRMAERWMRRFRRAWHGAPFDPTIGYLTAQTLVGAWPIDGERLSTYLLKAAREAKLRTSWTEPDEAYETALDAFARTIVENQSFTDELQRSITPFVRAGRVNSLSQVLLKLTSPGIPDVYQGTELWDLSLVDPDNRREVDFELREQMLSGLEAALTADPRQGPGADALLAAADSGLPKLWVLRQALHLRREHAESFEPGAAYLRLDATGPAEDHVVAFMRGESIATIVPRFPLKLARGRIGARLLTPASRWGDTRVELPSGRWRDALTGDRHVVRSGAHSLGVARALARFPVALLARED
jgi:(1->4)-alpha-D-glucan 1-alpha-D-glucosylmutase